MREGRDSVKNLETPHDKTVPCGEDSLAAANEEEQLQALKEATQEQLRAMRDEQKNSGRGRLAIILCGVICAFLELGLRRGSTWQWALLPVAGAVLIVAGVLMWRQDSLSREETDDP